MLTNDLPPPRASYVYQRNALFYFRFTFPLKISRLVGKRELRYSLRTGYRHSAVRRAMGLVVQVERFVWQLQKDSAMTQLSPQHLQALLDQHMRATLNQYEEQRIVSTQPLSHEDVENAGLVWDYLAEDTQDQLARNDYSRVSLGTNVLLEQNSIRLDPDSVEYRRFCRELLKTEARLIHIEQLRNQGKYDQPLENETLLPASPALPSVQTTGIGAAPAAPTDLATLIQAYLAEHQQIWTEKTEAEYAAILALFLTIVGNLPLVVLNGQTILHFRSLVSRLPANMNKLKQFKGKSIEQVLAMPDLKPMSRTNANKYLTRVSQLLGWAQALDYITKNFAEKKTLPADKRPDQQRDVFTPEDLRTIFLNEEYQHPVFKGRDREAYQYWLPLLGLFTGARIEELCQLQLADVRQQNDVWVLDISDEILAQEARAGVDGAALSDSEKKLKTVAAKRIVPIHKTLLELGFMEFVSCQKIRGVSRLFPELSKGRDGYSQIPSKWFGRFLDRRGITDSGKVFHSFRHTLTDHLKQQLVPVEIVREIIGHDRSEDVTFGRYGKAYRSQVLQQFIDAVDFRIDLGNLKDKWRELPALRRHAEKITADKKGGL